MSGSNHLKEGRELLTSQQAKDAFIQAGLSEATFHRRVNAGEINSILPEGRQRGAMYPKDQVIEAINKTSKARKKIKPKNPVKPATFGRAAVQDMPEIGELLRTFFSKINIEKRAVWIEKNPDVCYVLRSEGKIVGCAFVMPLDEQKILKILNSHVKPPTHAQDILLYESGQHYTLYVRSVVVLQSVPKLYKRYWGAKLIADIIKEVVNLGSRGVIVDKVYAQTDTRHVERLLKAIGFSQIISPTGSKNFMLDVSASGSVFAMQYKNALSRWMEE